VALPPGSRLEWVGEFGELQEAIDRLAVAAPLSLALICMLLFLNFGSMTDTILAASAIPDGHDMAGYLRCPNGIPFSVSAADRLVGTVWHLGNEWDYPHRLFQYAD